MTPAIQDRPYQHEFVHGNDRFPGVLRAWDEGERAVLGLLPTGTGKTICAGLVAIAARERGWRTLFLAHREELIRQAVAKLEDMGLSCGVEMADESVAAMTLFGGKPDVTVATVQTMQGPRLAAHRPDQFGVLMTDEAHHSRAVSYRRVYDHFKDYRHLGITATPDRGDRMNIGAVYGSVAFEYSLRRAIQEGWLVPIVTAKIPCGVNLRDIRTTGGDYNQSDLEARIAPHIEALCAITLAEVGARSTLVFCPDVGSAEAAAACFTALGQHDGSGVVARCVSGRTRKEDRREILAAYARGEFQVLTCCDLLIEGWDCPRVSAVVVMRPTRVRARYVQMIGRGTRPWGRPGEKIDCLVVDFAWETTDDHELVVALDLFDDSELDDAVAEVARKLMADGLARNPMDAIDDAERIVATRAAAAHRITGHRVGYRKIVFDPVGLGKFLGIPVKAGWDFNPASPATPRQREVLLGNGVDGVEKLSKAGASKIISAIHDRREAGLCTVKQVKYAIGLGMDDSEARALTFDGASAAIERLRNGASAAGRKG